MSFLSLSPERVLCQAISHFQTSWAASACTLADAALIYKQTTSLRLSEHLHPIRWFSNIVSGGWALWEAKELVDAFKKRSITTNPPIEVASFLVIGAITLLGAWFFPRTRPIPKEWNIEAQILEEKTEKNGIKSQVTLSLQPPRLQAIGYAIYLSRIVMNLAIAYLSPQRRLLCSLNTLALMVSLLKTHQLKWLNFSRRFDFTALLEPDNDPACLSIKQKIFSYVLPLLPPTGEAEKCPICQEETPTTCFTPKEPYHNSCLIDKIFEKSDYFLDNNKNIFTTTAHYKSGFHTHNTYSYKVKIPQENLPASSTSRIYPSNHFLQLIIEDPIHGKLPTTIEWITDSNAPQTRPLLSPTFWARLDSIYSAFQTLLAQMHHRHPELAGKILSAKHILSLFDVGMLIQNYYQLFHVLYQRHIPSKIHQNAPDDKVEEARSQLDAVNLQLSTLKDSVDAAIEAGTITTKIKVYNSQTPETKVLLTRYNAVLKQLEQAYNRHEAALENHTKLKASLEDKYCSILLLGLGVGSIALGGIAALAVSFLNRQLRPAFNLTEALKKIAAPADFNNMKVSWSAPWLQYISQCLFVSRIVVNLALAYFSSVNRRSYFLSASFQSLTLWKLAQLPWIKLERTFIHPLGANNVKNLHTSFEFLLPTLPSKLPGCPSAASHFESNLKAAYDFTTQFFKGSHWETYVSITKSYGIEVSRRFSHYEATVQQRPLAACGCAISGVIHNVTAWTINAVYGSFPVHIKYSVHC